MHPAKILIVDDEASVRTLLRYTLSNDTQNNEPYTLLEASDGEQTLEIADRELPDLILLDVMMSGLDGLDVLRRLHSGSGPAPIPVIMVTALNQDVQISTCLDAGAVDHITKPFSPLVVQARVRAVLHHHAAATDSRDPNAAS